MNRVNRTLYLLAIAIFAVGCFEVEHEGRRGRETSAVVNRSWPAAGIRELQVNEVDGSITVEAAATDQITLEAKARGRFDLDEQAENQGLFQTKLEGDTLFIGRHERRRRRGLRIPFVFGSSRQRIDYVLKVPAALTLEVKTVNGRITTRGVSGETEATSVNGRIDIETAGTHPLQATTVNGRVRAKFTEDFQGARFRTVNGRVQTILPRSASFNVDLSQVNGDFEAAFPLAIHSNPGSRRVSGEVNGGRHELKIVTVNGDVEISTPNGAPNGESNATN